MYILATKSFNMPRWFLLRLSWIHGGLIWEAPLMRFLANNLPEHLEKHASRTCFLFQGWIRAVQGQNKPLQISHNLYWDRNSEISTPQPSSNRNYASKFRTRPHEYDMEKITVPRRVSGLHFKKLTCTRESVLSSFLLKAVISPPPLWAK